MCYFRGDMNSDNTKRSKGRPSGSNSFVKIRLCDLEKLVGTMAVVPVSKVWLRENGIVTPENISPVAVATAPEQQEEKIQFSLTTFED
jgi:hypothetical protein